MQPVRAVWSVSGFIRHQSSPSADEQKSSARLVRSLDTMVVVEARKGLRRATQEELKAWAEGLSDEEIAELYESEPLTESDRIEVERLTALVRREFMERRATCARRV